MLAPAKRRASLYTLPLVIGIGVSCVVGLAAWRRSEAIAELADRVARGTPTEAAAAVRRLAAIPSPPLAVLVDAATSDERATAEAAQVAINRIVGQWQRQVDKQQRASGVAAEAADLAAILSSRRQAFATNDYAWLSSVTHNLLLVASKCPAKKTGMLALHCDEILAVVGRRTVNTEVRARAALADESSVGAASSGERALEQAQLEREFSEFPSQPISIAPEAEERLLAKDDAEPPSAAPHASRADLPPVTNRSVANETSITRDAKQKATWSEPMLRVHPAPPGNVPANDKAEPSTGAQLQTANLEPPRDAPSEVDKTRALFEQWLDATPSQRLDLEEELAERGFRRVPPRVVKQYLSADLAERLRIVDSVLTEPNVDARPWLLLLAEDENPDVRLMAVTVMATSGDKRLVEAALDAAIRDEDPRIADLAGRLRTKR